MLDYAENNQFLDACNSYERQQFVDARGLEETDRACQDRLHRPLWRGDRWVYMLVDEEGLSGPPVVTGNAPAFANRVLRDDYGRKLPEGELSIQVRQGKRIAPEYTPPPPDF